MEIWRYASISLLFGGLAGVVTPMLFTKFGRDAEREADLLGLEYEYAAGYDPQAFIHFFEKLHAQEEQKQNLIAKAFATHPLREDRFRRAHGEISSLLPDRRRYFYDISELLRNVGLFAYSSRSNLRATSLFSAHYAESEASRAFGARFAISLSAASREPTWGGTRG
jgi:predicted Zn-dependent protease